MVIADTLILRILTLFIALRAKSKLHDANNFNDFELEVKATAEQHDVGSKGVEV